MIRDEFEYRNAIKELGLLIEREDSLESPELSRMSFLADALISFERLAMEREGAPSLAATAQAKAEYERSKLGERSLVTA